MKPLFVSLVALFLCLSAPTLAQSVDQPAPPNAEAEIVLVAPSMIRVGELARLDVSESVAASFKWLLAPQTPDFEIYAEGSKAVFSARTEGEYRFVVACARGDTVDVVTHVIKVVGPPPMPQTDDLSLWIPFWNWSEMLPHEECEQLAEAFEGVAARQDELETAADWLKAISEANRKVLGDRIEAWKPMLNKIGAALRTRAETGALDTSGAHAAAWLEIAKGLRNCS